MSKEPVDYWREVVRRGVLALGFAIRRHQGETWMAAELVGPQDGMVARVAHAAMEIHKLIDLEPGTAAHAARLALLAQLETGPAARELAIYQGLLAERLWREIQDAPAQRLQAIAHPHE
jgi:hypothetical protein